MRIASLRSSSASLRQHVRLQVEHDLQPMLDLAQESVVLFQQRSFLMRQAAAVLELRDRLQRVAGAQAAAGRRR